MNAKGLTALVAVMAILGFISIAQATTILPDSSYAVSVGAWQGSSTYTDNGVNVVVEFAVYDSDNLQYQEEINFIDYIGAENLDEQYVYTYQIFCDDIGSGFIETFQLLDNQQNAIDQQIMYSTSAYDDLSGGVSPILPSTEQGIWVFEEGTLGSDDHSYILLLTSEYAPVVGDYEFTADNDETDVPVPEVPEPATIAILSLGALLGIRKRK